MDVWGQRTSRRNRRKATEEVCAVSREEDPDESNDEGEEILDERDTVPVRIRIPGERGRVGPPSAAIPASIDLGMWLNMVTVKTPHLADLEIESMKKLSSTIAA